MSKAWLDHMYYNSMFTNNMYRLLTLFQFVRVLSLGSCGQISGFRSERSLSLDSDEGPGTEDREQAITKVQRF